MNVKKVLKILVFSLNPEMCKLMKKFFAKFDYKFDCVKIEIDSDWRNQIFDKEIDCIILDTNINSRVQVEIRQKFSKAIFILIPSFSSEPYPDSNSADLIPEPFKFSELEKALSEIYKSKATSDAL